MLTESDFFEPTAPLYEAQAELFSGRREILGRGLQALSKSHSLVIYYGDLGIGKSSVARQLYMILNNEPTARSHQPQLSKLADASGASKLTPLWFSCRGYDDMDSVLRAICFSMAADNNDSFSKLFPGFTEKTQNWIIETALEAKLGPVGGKVSGKQDKKISDDAVRTAKEDYLRNISGADIFFHLLGRLHEEDKELDIVLFLDDFERLLDKSEFPAIFLRSNKLRYVLVGIAESPGELIDHNESMERHLLNRQIRVDPLGLEDIQWIFSNAEKVAKQEKANKRLFFSSGFIDRVAAISGKLPMIVQYYGHAALVATNALARLPKEAITIEEDVIDLIEANFFEATKSVQPQLIDRIREGVGQSVARPRVLRAIADKFPSWFTLAEARKIPDLDTINKIEDHLDRLVDVRLLVKSSTTKKYRFTTPTSRMLCRRVPDKGDPASTLLRTMPSIAQNSG